MLRDEPLRLQVRVELLHHRQRRLEQVVGDVAHRHVVRESNLVADGLEPAAAGDGQHLGRQRPAEAESGSARREPELQLVLKQTIKITISIFLISDHT